MAFSALFAPGASLFAGDAQPVHKYGTISTAAGNLLRGTLLGRITATDKYIPSLAGASDGSQNPVAILSQDTDASGGDIYTAMYFEGEYAWEMMVVDASWTFSSLAANLRQNTRDITVRQLGIYA